MGQRRVLGLRERLWLDLGVYISCDVRRTQSGVETDGHAVEKSTGPNAAIDVEGNGPVGGRMAPNERPAHAQLGGRLLTPSHSSRGSIGLGLAVGTRRHNQDDPA